MYELKKLERYLRVNLLGPGPCLIKKITYRAAVSQMLRNTALKHGLRPLVDCDCRFVFLQGHGCMSLVTVVCCQLEESYRVR